MAVFRVERNTGYTVMSNHHLRNKELSLKAKGLLSQMLSLPEDWDYTLAGLSYINRESIDAIRTAVWELEKAGYITRRQGRDEKGKMTAIEYTIYEQPQPPALDCPVLENPTADNPILENPTADNPTSENPMQLNKDIQKTDLSKKEKSNTDLSSNHSIPILSPNPSPLREETAESERKGTEAADAYSVYEEIIKDNIEYEHFIKHTDIDRERLDEIVSLILETVCTKRKTIRIAGDDYPAELVKAKFMKLNSSHIEFVFDCMLAVWIFSFTALVLTKLLLYGCILIGSQFMVSAFPLDFNMASLSFYVQLILKSVVIVTMSFIALFIGLAMKSSKATIISSFLLIILTQANIGDFTMANNAIFPVILTLISLIFAFLSIQGVENKDLM